MLKNKLFHVAAAGVLTLAAAGNAVAALTPFQQDVATAINNGLAYLTTNGVFNNPSSLGVNGASGIAVEALLEKRPSGNPADPPQGYTGAIAADQALLRSAAEYMLTATSTATYYAYRDGSWMFALSGYALTGGPDKSVLAPANAAVKTIKQTMDALVDRTLANQTAPGYWCYTAANCFDSSTTQYAVAGLNAARVFYQSVKSGDAPYADGVRSGLIDAALAKARNVYVINAATGGDNAGCNVLTATERGHGYHPKNEGYNPSLQQTASGIYIQLFGGADVNTPNVQAYMEWLRNRYRYTDLDSLGNSWPTLSYGYYLWSSFKAMELIRQSGVVVGVGNIGPNDLGTLPAGNAPACVVRESNKDPAVITRPALFGVGGAGIYAAETKGQYFDYAHQLIAMQCANGAFTCTGYPGSWEGGVNASHNGYALLVLQRATGVIISRCDVDGNGIINRADINAIRLGIGQSPGANDVRDANVDGKITIVDVRLCTQQCTNTSCN